MQIQRLTRILAVAALAAAVVVAPASAQMSGRIVGTVVDDMDHSISGMSVRATDLLDGSKVYFATSDSDGGFVLSDVPVGTYVVAAETANTQWVQKHDSPVVKVSADPSTVVLTLVSLAQLQGDGGGGGGITPIQGVTLGAAVVGAVAGGLAYKEASDSNDTSQSALDAANRAANSADAANDSSQNNANKIDQLEDKVDGYGDRFDNIDDQLDDLNNDNNDLNNRLDDLEDVIIDIFDTLN